VLVLILANSVLLVVNADSTATGKYQVRHGFLALRSHYFPIIILSCAQLAEWFFTVSFTLEMV
jgi:hypothetical protein